MRANFAQTKRVRMVEMRTETIQSDGSARLRRAEVGQQRNQFRHARILGRRLARKTIKDVPEWFDSKFPAPAQQLNVFEAGRPFLHEAQDLVAEAFDPGLNPTYAPLPEERQLLESQVRFRFVEELHLRPALNQLRKEGLKIFDI